MSLDLPENRITGRLRKYHSNFYYVEADGVLYECMLRGLIKKEGTDVLVGDFVTLDTVDPVSRTARLYEVQPRKSAITRPKIANVDRVIVLYSLKEPLFDPVQMDRYLTHVELAGLEAVLCISKSDLATDDADLEKISELYGSCLGYQILFTSVRRPESLQPVLEAIRNRISVLAGPSGAGKSSLLNALNPELKLRVGEVSDKLERGQHTTRHVELLQLYPDDPATLIADTPGFSNLRFNYVLPGRIEAVYRDFASYREQCAFSDCLHIDEEDCAVLENMDKIPESRYASYRAIVAEALEYKEEARNTSRKEAYGYKQVSKKGKDAVKILRLKERDRDVSRRTQRQQVDLLETEHEPDDLGGHEGGFEESLEE